jgi:membrane protein DedA with SNARE-associated domain
MRLIFQKRNKDIKKISDFAKNNNYFFLLLCFKLFCMKKISIAVLSIVLLFSTTVFANTQENATAPAPEKTSLIEKTVSWYMDNINYGTITLLMTAESTVIPFPSEMIVPPAAYKASQEGSDLNILLVIFFATMGAIMGSTINYCFALWLGRPVIYRFAESRLGKMFLLSTKKVKQSEDYFVKHGKASTFIGRLVPGIRHLISLPAGLAKMHFGTFILFTGLGALIWNIILVAVGYVAHGSSDLIDKYSKQFSYLLFGLGILFVLYLIYNGFFKKKKNAR